MDVVVLSTRLDDTYARRVDYVLYARDIRNEYIPTVNLPSSNRFINIIIVINYLIKMKYIIPIDLINIILVAKCFVKYVFKLYRLLNLIISNYKS